MADELGRAPGASPSSDSNPSQSPGLYPPFSGPPSEQRRSSSQLLSPRMPDLVRDSKLETHFIPDSSVETVHTYHEPDYKSRRRLVSRSEHWRRYGKIGGGSYGSVWLEKCVKGARRENGLRAVKQMEVRRQSTRVDYNRELEAIAKFSHWKYERAFVKSFGWYEGPDHLFIAMEYLELGDLHTYLQHKPALPEHEAKEVTFQILDGLFLMHDNEFAHRDMKPRNILLKSCPPDEWWVKIADFGISKRIEDEVGASSTLKGTLGYIAPELHGFIKRGSPYAPDLWAVGEIAFQMLTKQATFKNLGMLFTYMSNLEMFPYDLLLAARVGQSGLECIFSFMHPDPIQRVTAEVALQHTWFNDAPLSRQGSVRSARNISPPARVADTETEELATWNTIATQESENNPPGQIGEAEIATWNTEHSHGKNMSLDAGQPADWPIRTNNVPLAGDAAPVEDDMKIHVDSPKPENTGINLTALDELAQFFGEGQPDIRRESGNMSLDAGQPADWPIRTTNVPLAGDAAPVEDDMKIHVDSLKPEITGINSTALDELAQIFGEGQPDIHRESSTQNVQAENADPQSTVMEGTTLVHAEEPTAQAGVVRERVPAVQRIEKHSHPILGGKFDDLPGSGIITTSNAPETIAPTYPENQRHSLVVHTGDEEEPETFIARRLREIRDSRPQDSPLSESSNVSQPSNAAATWAAGITSSSERPGWQSYEGTTKQSSDGKSKISKTFKGLFSGWRSNDPKVHNHLSEFDDPGRSNPHLEPQIPFQSDTLYTTPPPIPSSSRKVFGVTIDELYSRHPDMPVPQIVQQCIAAVETYALNLQGIYRQSEKPGTIERMIAEFELNWPHHDLKLPAHFHHNIHNVTSLLKRYFRDLPNPLLTLQHYHSFISAAKVDDDIGRRDSIHALINQLSDPHYVTLRALTFHLDKVQQRSNQNRMTTGNLAIIFGPTLMGSNTTNMVDTGWQVRVVETIITYASDIFDED
ncbi:kinase-like protein [Aspergillus affinis]|uniref:kinase-like protein n=1 Tax=Aspergillus affinis TaxID=1070780 RepID=UPI0022FE41FB|nr:kinase-like protein [Aspergillus affinis]KAI9043586.1 kinase-like protein [Aspergillus affinis]